MIAAGRDDALGLIRAALDDGLAWAQGQAPSTILGTTSLTSCGMTPSMMRGDTTWRDGA